MHSLASRKKFQKYRKHLLVTGLLLLAMAAGICIYRCVLKQSPPQAKSYDMEQLSSETYDLAFFSMYPIENYNADDFVNYMALKPFLATYQIPDLSEISEYLDKALGMESLKAVCLGLDPYRIWLSDHQKTGSWNKDLKEHLLSYIEANPSLQFDVLLPYPPLEAWLSLEEKDLEYALATYRGMISHLSDYENANVFFIGAEPWLIENPNNYEGEAASFDAAATPFLSQRILLLTLCDKIYQIEPGNMNLYFDRLLERIAAEKNAPTVYPDLSAWHIVFFGDSIIGNYFGSTSIPGVIAGLSGASCYNYAFGGTQATDRDDYDLSFPDVAAKFPTGELETHDDHSYPYGAEAKEGAQLCFVIDYGINDYANGCPLQNEEDPCDPESFSGSLRTGIQRLKKAYPDAIILLVSPTFCSLFNNGLGIQSEEGGTLTDYVAAMENAAQSEGVLFLNSYTDLGVNGDNYKEFIADDCHLNEAGRFLLGQKIIARLEELTPSRLP